VGIRCESLNVLMVFPDPSGKSVKIGFIANFDDGVDKGLEIESFGEEADENEEAKSPRFNFMPPFVDIEDEDSKGVGGVAEGDDVLARLEGVSTFDARI
jgi:hypothetical protein